MSEKWSENWIIYWWLSLSPCSLFNCRAVGNWNFLQADKPGGDKMPQKVPPSGSQRRFAEGKWRFLFSFLCFFAVWCTSKKIINWRNFRHKSCRRWMFHVVLYGMLECSANKSEATQKKTFNISGFNCANRKYLRINWAFH